MNGNIIEKKGKRKICRVLLVVALLGVVTMIPSVCSTNYNTDEHKIITDNSFSLWNNNIFSQLLNYRQRSVSQESLFPTGLLSSTVYTNCNGVEKSTKVSFGVLNAIDVDNNPNTGVNGADIQVQYLLLPWIEFDPTLAIGGLFTISVERLGEEIKDADFRIALQVQLDTNIIHIGYYSLKEAGNEIPDMTRLSLYYYLLSRSEPKGLVSILILHIAVVMKAKKLSFLQIRMMEVSSRVSQ
jgi:hypothetical protein